MLKAWFINVLRPWVPSDFTRGAVMALILVVLFMLLWWIIRLICHLCNRRYRCSKVTVPFADGNILISAEALADTVSRELQHYPQLTVRKIDLFRRRSDYQLEIDCLFCADAESDSLPALTASIKLRLNEKLQKTFGIENLNKIVFSVSRFQQKESSEEPQLQ